MKKQGNKKRSGKDGTLLASVKVVGIGGGGGNAIDRMSRNFTRGVDFIAINTDHQDLDQVRVRRKIYIGRNLTRGLGTGMNPDLGRQAAEENRSEIAEALAGADLVFVTGGLGGGTCTGAAPIIAEAARQAGALTVAVVTKPFAFEGVQRDRIAREGLVKLKEKADALIVVPNDRIFTVISKDTPILKAFEAIDNVLKGALNGIVELIASPGIINVDFADVKSIVQDAGVALIGVGTASGAERAVNAANIALNSPLLETSADGAKAVLLGISGGRDLKMAEINDAAKIVSQVVDPGARIIFGAYHDKNLRPNQVKITLIATGFNGGQANSLFGGHVAEKRQNGFHGTAAHEHDYGRKTDDGAAPRKTPAAGHAKIAAESATDAGAPEERENEEKAHAKESNKKDSDIWDIPTFLRRKKR